MRKQVHSSEWKQRGTGLQVQDIVLSIQQCIAVHWRTDKEVTSLIEKNVWYNNYGFYNAQTGNYVAGSDWLGTAMELSEDEAFREIESEMLRGLLK